MSPIIETTIPEGVPGPRLKTARGIYDFAVDGGGVSTKNLMGDTLIPSGATILGGWVEITTPLASLGAATVAISVEGANDIINAAAFDGAPWSTGGRKSVIPVFTGATTVRTTAARDIKAAIAGAAITAGKFSVILVYADPLA